MCLIGKKLEDFTVPAYYKKEITEISLSQVLGHWSVFIFYPADFSFVCPTELEEMETLYRACELIEDFAGEAKILLGKMMDEREDEEEAE